MFETLKEAKLTLKLRKCYFGCKEDSYLGYNVSAEGLKLSPVKLKAIKEFPIPKDKHEVRRFMGLIGFFSRFIRKYAEIACPVSDLLKTEVQFEWGELEEQAFSQLQDELLKESVIKLYDSKADTELHFSGMLLQQEPMGKWRVVQAVSKKSTDAESRYHSGRLQFLIFNSFGYFLECIETATSAHRY